MAQASVAAVRGFPGLPGEVLAVNPSRRRQPVVVDANALIEDVLWRARTGYSALTILAEQKLVSVVAPPHVVAEVREHLPEIAARKGCAVAIEVFEAVHLPIVRCVDLPGELPSDARVRGVAMRDADDAPLEHLATLLAPAVVLTRDRHLTREGFGQGDWLTTMLLVRRLVELDQMLYGGSRFVWLSMYLPGLGLTALIRRLAQSEIASGLALGLLVGGLLWFRRQLRTAAASAWERVEPALEQLSEAMLLALEDRARTTEALEALLVCAASTPTAESAAARFLVERGDPVTSERIHAALVSRDYDISLAVTRQMLRAHPAFVGVRGRGYQLGRIVGAR